MKGVEQEAGSSACKGAGSFSEGLRLLYEEGLVWPGLSQGTGVFARLLLPSQTGSPPPSGVIPVLWIEYRPFYGACWSVRESLTKHHFLCLVSDEPSAMAFEEQEPHQACIVPLLLEPKVSLNMYINRNLHYTGSRPGSSVPTAH